MRDAAPARLSNRFAKGCRRHRCASGGLPGASQAPAISEAAATPAGVGAAYGHGARSSPPRTNFFRKPVEIRQVPASMGYRNQIE
jgi:hypothetical protein